MRALVTGAAGFIGSNLCERLIADGHDVVGVDCFTDYYDRWRKQQNIDVLLAAMRFHFEERDLAVAPLDDLLTGIDTVFHLAGQPGARRSFGGRFVDYVRNNVTATQRLLEAAAGHEIDAFVYASSAAVYGDAMASPTSERAPRLSASPCGVTAAAVEDLAALHHRTAGIPVVGMRYFTVYGPRQRPDMAFTRFIDQALSDRPISIYGDGRQQRDFTYVDDAVEATIAAARRGRRGEVYNVGGGAPVELLEAIGIIAERCGGVSIEHQPAVRGDARATCADGALALADLGTCPRVTLRDGLHRQIAWAVAAGLVPTLDSRGRRSRQATRLVRRDDGVLALGSQAA
jgi:nucleoside-diphosphate-sugar epimerase